MNKRQRQLQSVLQALALPVTGQLRLYPNEKCKLNRLIKEYSQVEPLFLANWAGCMTESQKALLISLRQELMIVCHGKNHFRSEVALRRSAGWQRVRLLARSALVAFNWPLTLPPQFETVLATQ